MKITRIDVTIIANYLRAKIKVYILMIQAKSYNLYDNSRFRIVDLSENSKNESFVDVVVVVFYRMMINLGLCYFRCLGKVLRYL